MNLINCIHFLIKHVLGDKIKLSSLLELMKQPFVNITFYTVQTQYVTVFLGLCSLYSVQNIRIHFPAFSMT